MDGAIGTRQEGAICEIEDGTIGQELVMPKFSFVPLHRVYSYPSGGQVSRTVIVVEINLPSGVGPKMFDVSVVDGGSVLEVEVEVEWPSYLLDLLKFNGKWLEGTGDGTLGVTDSRIASATRHAQDIIREYGKREVRSSVRIVLPRKVEEKVENMKVNQLGFIDPKNVLVKSNELPLLLRLLVHEEMPITLLNVPEDSGFAVVKTPSEPLVTQAPGSGIESL